MLRRYVQISLVLSCLLLATFTTNPLPIAEQNQVQIKHETYDFSQPQIRIENNYTTIQLAESNAYTQKIGAFPLPLSKKIYTFPFGTKIHHIECVADYKILSISKPIRRNEGDVFEDYLIQDLSVSRSKNISKCESTSFQSNQLYSYHLGSGVKQNDLVLYVVLDLFPVQYIEEQQKIRYTESIEVSITYELPKHSTTFASLSSDIIDLLIITPSKFTDALAPLVYHKNSIQTTTIMKTLDEIYDSSPGRDHAEQIKYYIKQAKEAQGISYVLLVGSIYEVPIRTSNTSIFGRWEHPVLSDLYYADLYTDTTAFSSWDTNENDVFGETGIDELDLYPDVHVGRIPCDTIEELSIVIDKIITYETQTFGSYWFNNMIFIGGNTFPQVFSWGNEGEEHNEIIMDLMTDFKPSSVIWTSKHNFNPVSITRAINKGAGFLDYSGHGFEHGMGTYKPHGRRMKTYLTPYVSFLKNGYKLPIIFFDACLTAKLDFVLQDILDYKQYRIFDILARLTSFNTSIILPCYAWSFLKHANGGSIATIGATRTAFGGKDFGCEKLSTDFFSAYARGMQLGDMFSAAQTTYRQDLPDDEFTIEEFILLGDPSLHVGGYSTDSEPPMMQVINPKEGYIHIFGIPVFPQLSSSESSCITVGGFRLKPMQFKVDDNLDDPSDIAVYLCIEGENKIRLSYNEKKQVYEYHWTGFGFGTSSVNITAIDRSGNQYAITEQISYNGLFPIFPLSSNK